MKRWKFGLLLIGVLLLSLAAPVFAGGWAVINIENMPKEIRAGEDVMVEFSVMQHGQHLVHEISFDGQDSIPVTPEVRLTSTKSGEELTFAAQKSKAVGYYTASLQFPSEGEWQWSITPDPLANTTALPTLTVLPAAKTEIVPASPGTPNIVFDWTMGIILLGAVVLVTVVAYLKLRPLHSENY